MQITTTVDGSEVVGRGPRRYCRAVYYEVGPGAVTLEDHEAAAKKWLEAAGVECGSLEVEAVGDGLTVWEVHP